jgi:phosphate transport system substrate-binding protein
MKLKKLVMSLGLAGMAAASSLTSLSAFAAVDSAIPTYKKASGVSGNVSSVGSDTLANMMTLWAEEFKRQYPNVNIQIQAAGSSTAPPALTEGTSNLGPMSRKMKDKEIEAFENKFGYKPTAIPVAIDALAVFVNKDNPIKGLNIAGVDAIFSANRKCGAPKGFNNWGDAGLNGAWAGKKIELYGRNSVSGTYGYFKKKGLCKGDYRNTVKEQPGSASVVQAVSASVNGVGYSGMGYKTSSVRAVPLAKKGGNFIEATPANAVNGTYPLSRFLYMYVNKKPNQDLLPIEREFTKMILSQQGQSIVAKDGYIPLPAKVVQKTMKKLGL